MARSWTFAASHAMLLALTLFSVASISAHNSATAQEGAKTQETGSNEKTAGIKGLKTVAESSQYKATSRSWEVEAYLKQLATSDSNFRLESLGDSVEGRSLWGLTWNAQPEGSSKKDRLVVLLLGNIHSGECDGKEALLALARDIVIETPAAWRDHLTLIFVPNYNVDAGERIGKGHRPGQAGPEEGMGVRENPQGLDLNRDFAKLESPEANALIRAITKYQVDALVDCHTTNGSLHRYEITYSTPQNPAAPKALADYLRSNLMPAMDIKMKERGYNTFWYGNFEQGHDRWTTYGHEPRYSVDYMGMRGRIGILVESYSYAPYQTRIESSYWFVRNCLDKLAAESTKVRSLIEQADAEMQQSAKNFPEFPIKSELEAREKKVKILGYKLKPEGNQATPSTVNELEFYLGGGDRSRLEPFEYETELWTRFAPKLSVAMPTGYLIPSEYAWALERLERHGVQIQKVLNASSVDVERYRIKKAAEESNFQGHRLWNIDVESVQEKLDVAAGTYFVPTAQPLGRLVAYLLEPHSDDNLAKWNFFDPEIRIGNIYPVARVLANSTVPATLPAKVTPGERLTIEKLFSSDRRVSFGGAGFAAPPRWLPDRAEYLVRKETSYLVVNAATGDSYRFEELTRFAKGLDELDAFDAGQARAAAQLGAFNESMTRALVQHSRDLFLYDAASGKATRFTNTPEASEDLAELSPTGDHVAFVRDNNLYVVDAAQAKEIAITQDGSVDKLNGILDWVYQEEVYGRGNFKAFWWSPDGKRIAFLQLDQTPVDSYGVSDSISVQQSLESTRYPKAGAPLPAVRLLVADAITGATQEVDLSSYPADDRLIVRVGWNPAGDKVVFQVQNRIQTWLDLCAAQATDGKVTKLFRENGKAWVDVIETPRWLPDGDFLWMSDLPNGRRHVYRIAADGTKRRPVTEGDWDVSSISWMAKDGSAIIVEGNRSSPIETHAYHIDLRNGSFRSLTKSAGTHSVDVDPTGKFYFDRYSSIAQPTRSDLWDLDGKLVRSISVPTNDRANFVEISKPKLIEIPARDGLPLQAMIIAPPGVDLAAPGRKYPVLFHVYGGPQAPTVANRSADGNYWWHQMLAQNGYFVVLCDNRASRGRGAGDTWTIHRNLGEVELKDLEDAARWVGNQPWGDSSRIGVWGWSYGGYFTAYAMTHSKLFKAGIAGAPVTDWKNYDAIYTERYMDTPQNNPKGYKSSSAVEAADQLHGRLLLIHGERDDNVHISNTLQMAYQLQKAGKQFDLMVYPKNRHGVVDPQQRRHMHEMMTKFLLDNL